MSENMYGFSVQNWKAKLAGFPEEDNYNYDSKRRIACVADGVTRDFVDGSVATHDVKGVLKSYSGKYPLYAKKASGICVRTFGLTKSAIDCNDAIGYYNLNTFDKVDYLANDWAGCTFAGVYGMNGVVHWEFIADSGIAVIDKKGNVKFKTADEGPHSFEKNPHLEDVLREHGGFANPEGRRIIRSQYRNNPKEPHAYGVLTGELNALHYLKEGLINPEKGDYVLVFTDGVRGIIFPKDKNRIEQFNYEFADKLLEDNSGKLEKYCKKRVRSEGTLVVWKIE